MKVSRFGRRAISPVIATVLIITVTMISAVSIGGFVFGYFGSMSNSARVLVSSQNLVAADWLSTNAAAAPTCLVSGAANDLILTNIGTAPTTVTGATITWAGSVNSFAVSGACTVAATGQTGATTNGNPICTLFSATNKLSSNAVIGQQYTGTVTLGNGAVLMFTGTFV